MDGLAHVVPVVFDGITRLPLQGGLLMHGPSTISQTQNMFFWSDILLSSNMFEKLLHKKSRTTREAHFSLPLSVCLFVCLSLSL